MPTQNESNFNELLTSFFAIEVDAADVVFEQHEVCRLFAQCRSLRFSTVTLRRMSP